MVSRMLFAILFFVLVVPSNAFAFNYKMGLWVSRNAPTEDSLKDKSRWVYTTWANKLGGRTDFIGGENGAHINYFQLKLLRKGSGKQYRDFRIGIQVKNGNEQWTTWASELPRFEGIDVDPEPEKTKTICSFWSVISSGDEIKFVRLLLDVHPTRMIKTNFQIGIQVADHKCSRQHSSVEYTPLVSDLQVVKGESEVVAVGESKAVVLAEPKAVTDINRNEPDAVRVFLRVQQ